MRSLAFPKRPPLRSRGYLAWVRSQACCNCHRVRNIQAHHHGTRGISQKTDDLRAVPLCFDCHQGFHNTGFLPNTVSTQQADLIIAQAQVDLLVRWIELCATDSGVF